MRNTTVAATMTGTASKAMSVSSPSVATNMMVTPIRVPTATIAWASPVCKNDDSVSMSVVMRVMIRPER